MTDLKEQFVENGTTFVFTGTYVEIDGAVRARGTLSQGPDWFKTLDIPANLGGRDVEEMTEAEIEAAAIDAVIEWVRDSEP